MLLNEVVLRVIYLRAFISFVGSSFLALLRNLGDSGKKEIIKTAMTAGSDIKAVKILHPILFSTIRAKPLDIASPEFQNIVITTNPAALKTLRFSSQSLKNNLINDYYLWCVLHKTQRNDAIKYNIQA